MFQIDEVAELNHEELPVSLNTDDQGREIPIELRMFLEKTKKDYLNMIEKMQVRSAQLNKVEEVRLNDQAYLIKMICKLIQLLF